MRREEGQARATVREDHTLAQTPLPVLIALGVVMMTPVSLPVCAIGYLVWQAGRVRGWLLTLVGTLVALVVWATATDGLEGLARDSFRAWRLVVDVGPSAELLSVAPALVGHWWRAGLAIGLVAAGGICWWQEQRLRGERWHPWERRRQEQDAARRRARAGRRAARSGEHAAALAVVIDDGDLDRREWRRSRRLLIPSEQVMARPQAVFAAPGAGKTEELLRRVRNEARARRRLTMLDCKGTDPDLPGRLIAAYLTEWPDARVRLWPVDPYDMWRCDRPGELVARLMAVIDFSEPFYRDMTKLSLQLACDAPQKTRTREDGSVEVRGGPPSSAEDLIGRLDVAVLQGLYGDRNQYEQAQIAGLDPRVVAAARSRYSSFFRGLHGAFDRSPRSWALEDADLALFVVPTLADPEDGNSAVRLLLADARHYAGRRKPRAIRESFIIDEFSAVPGGALIALDLAERGRDPGLTVVLTAQSPEGVGDERTARRLLQACSGGVVLLRCASPELILSLAGRRERIDRTWRLDPYGPTDQASMRLEDDWAIDPTEVRQAQTGEAWIIAGGRWAHVQIIREQPSPLALERAAAILQQGTVRAGEQGFDVEWLHRYAARTAQDATVVREQVRPREQFPDELPAGPVRRELPAPPSREVREYQQLQARWPAVIAWLIWTFQRWTRPLRRIGR